MVEYPHVSEGTSAGASTPSYMEPMPRQKDDTFRKFIAHHLGDQQAAAEAERRDKRSSSRVPVYRKSPSRTRQPEGPGQLRVLIVEV